MPYKESASGARCKNACPAGVDIPRYVRLIAQGKVLDAFAVIRESVPFPSICGRVCFHPCEQQCSLGKIGAPLAINELKRFAADFAAGSECRFEPEGPAAADKEKVAIVGSGPSGLTAAYHLAKLGYRVTVWEALAVPGGMLAVGIPEYRLPKEVLQREIETVEKLGVELRLNAPIGQSRTVDDLFAQGFKAVFLAVGATKSRELQIPGERLSGVLSGIAFLERVNRGETVAVGDKCIVIGGGNAALDAARSALRLGAKEVNIQYRRTREEMPAFPEEVAAALQEGVTITYLSAPKRIREKKGGGLALESSRMALREPDASGRRRPVPVDGSGFTVDAATIIIAIGEEPDSAFLPAEFARNQDGTLVVDSATLSTTVPGVFAGGDFVSGPASVISAIAAGRKAARSIDRFLGGIEELRAEEHAEGPFAQPLQGLPIRVSRPSNCLAPETRVQSFAEVNLPLAREQCLAEAGECLGCDLPIAAQPEKCTGCMACAMVCSLAKLGFVNPMAACIRIETTLSGYNRINFTDECDNCGVCARYCPYDALSRSTRVEQTGAEDGLERQRRQL